MDGGTKCADELTCAGLQSQTMIHYSDVCYDITWANRFTGKAALLACFAIALCIAQFPALHPPRRPAMPRCQLQRQAWAAVNLLGRAILVLYSR